MKKKTAAVPATPAVDNVDPPTVTLRSLRSPFVARGNTVKLDGRVILQHVGPVTLLYTPARAQLTPPQHEVFDDILYELRSTERTVVRITSLQEFADGKAQLQRLIMTEKTEIAEELTKLGMQLSTEEKQALSALSTLRDRVVAFFGSFKPAYEMLGVRKQNEQPLRVQDGKVLNESGHGLRVTQAKNIWERAYKVWALGQADDGRGTVVYDFDRKNINVYPERIRVGCQTISRWQAENLAAEMGWI